MAENSAQASRPPAAATVAEVMEPALTTVDLNDHVAAAAYLMKHAGTTALVVLDSLAGRPIGILTDTDVTHVVADGKNVNDVRIADVMTPNPTVIEAGTSIRQAAELMTARHFRHLPVVGDSGLTGIVDVSALCRALLGPQSP
jgi:CBS domain-containing protein